MYKRQHTHTYTYTRILIHTQWSALPSYRERDLPRVFEELYKLELARLDVVKEYLAKYAKIYSEMSEPLQQLSSHVAQSVSAMDTEDDLDNFIDSWCAGCYHILVLTRTASHHFRHLCFRVAVHGEPPNPIDFRYDLPTTPDDIRRNR